MSNVRAMCIAPGRGSRCCWCRYADGHVVRPTDDTKPEGEVDEPHPTESMSTSKSGDPKPEGKGKGKAIDMEDDPTGDGNDANARNEPPKKKGKEKAIDTDDDDDPIIGKSIGAIPPRPTPRRPGWGRSLEEDFFHTVPQSHGDPSKKRAVFRYWPRKRSSKPLGPSKFRGKLSPEGLPTVDCFVSVSTSTMLREVMESIGESDAAAPEIEWAKTEGQPRVEGVADTEEQIRRIHAKLWLWQSVSSSSRDAAGTEERDSEQYKRVSECPYAEIPSWWYHDDKLPTSIPPPPTIPVTSPFHPSHYPKPWPFTPFENSLPILLQERIPLYLLPETLYVHDPFWLLLARERRFRNTSWTSRPDIVRTYNLNISKSVRSQIEEARRTAEELEEFKAPYHRSPAPTLSSSHDEARRESSVSFPRRQGWRGEPLARVQRRMGVATRSL
ncbi:hypothetical protein EV363DRAFT_49809 [Boletus edulis]|nr:hypothetical protein EV363DRAFT_49809 [Boletus edulis]